MACHACTGPMAQRSDGMRRSPLAPIPSIMSMADGTEEAARLVTEAEEAEATAQVDEYGVPLNPLSSDEDSGSDSGDDDDVTGTHMAVRST